MRLPALLLAVVLLAGCGSETGERAPAASTAPEVQSGASLPFDEAEVTKPPPIVLLSAAGIQEAVKESSCVDYVDEASGQGVGVCGDTPDLKPERLSLVRSGEETTILVEGADVIRPEGCVAEAEQDCTGSASVRRLGCEEEIASIALALGPETRWRADLPPGTYELQVFAYFEAPDGRSGDVSGSLGLLVEATGPQKILPAPDELVACPEG
jgi:hypothetical protein